MRRCAGSSLDGSAGRRSDIAPTLTGRAVFGKPRLARRVDSRVSRASRVLQAVTPPHAPQHESPRSPAPRSACCGSRRATSKEPCRRRAAPTWRRPPPRSRTPVCAQRFHSDGTPPDPSLRRLEAAHLQHHRRELELVKRVSLAQIEPVALILLRENGECWIEVDEVLFDLMHPGHYLRRSKSVSLTVATVGDPVAESRLRSHCSEAPSGGHRARIRVRWWRTTPPGRSRLRRAPAKMTRVCSSTTSTTSASCRSRDEGRSVCGTYSCRRSCGRRAKGAKSSARMQRRSFKQPSRRSLARSPSVRGCSICSACARVP